jgi:citrate lyase subunit beta/citryl-CoA lyase
MPGARPIRSALWAPGSDRGALDEAARSPADAVYIDLESSVSKSGLAEARGTANAFIKDGPSRPSQIYAVRVNPMSSDYFFDDLESVVHPNLSCVILPKIADPAEVTACDRAISFFERRCGLPPASILIHPIIETAAAVRLAYEIGSASNRVAYMGGVSAPGGDINSAIGFEWTPEGLETLFLRSKVLIDARAAGVPYPISGMSIDRDNDEQFNSVARQVKQLGYSGMQIAYPHHAVLANDVFTPSAEQIAYWRDLVVFLDAEEARGNAITTFRGRIVDTEMTSWAQDGLAFAKLVGAFAEE